MWILSRGDGYNLRCAKKLSVGERHGYWTVIAHYSDCSVIIDEFETEWLAQKYLNELVDKLNSRD
mgnify:CR=1 FL=1